MTNITIQEDGGTFRLTAVGHATGRPEVCAAVSDQLQQQIEDIAQDVSAAQTALAGKQDKISGTAGQVVGFNAVGQPVAQDPAGHHHTAAEVGAIPSTGMDLNGPLEFKSATSDGWISVYTIAPNRERFESLITPYYMSTKRVSVTDSPTNGTDAANKSYVDGKVAAVTPDSIGAAAVGHSHMAEDVGAASIYHTHDPAQVGALPENPPKIDLSDTYGYVSMGSSALQYDEYTKTIACVPIGQAGAIYPTLAPFGCATPTADFHAANKKYVDGAVQQCLTQTQADGRYLKLSGGTMTGTMYAQRNTGYGTSQVRNIYFTTTDLTAGSSSLNSGDIAIVYE